MILRLWTIQSPSCPLNRRLLLLLSITVLSVVSVIIYKHLHRISLSLVVEHYNIPSGETNFQEENFRPHFEDLADLDSGVDNNDIPIPNYTAAIIYLADERRHRQLLESLFHVFHNLKTYPWPIIIFHTGAFDAEFMRTQLRNRLFEHIFTGSYNYAGTTESNSSHRVLQFVSRIDFERLVWELPSGLPTEAELDPIAFSWVWPGYHHMCNFYAYQIFHHPRLENITYYLRLDTDSYIYGPVCFDPFERMEKRNLTYAYRLTDIEEPWVMGTFWETLDNYLERFPEVRNNMRRNGLSTPPAEDRESTNLDIWWNNFEVVRMKSFIRPDIQNWYEELQSMPEKIYKYRWGDAVIRTATTKMFFDEKYEVEKFCAIPYWHNRKESVCDCDIDVD